MATGEFRVVVTQETRVVHRMIYHHTLTLACGHVVTRAGWNDGAPLRRAKCGLCAQSRIKQS